MCINSPWHWSMLQCSDQKESARKSNTSVLPYLSIIDVTCLLWTHCAQLMGYVRDVYVKYTPSTLLLNDAMQDPMPKVRSYHKAVIVIMVIIGRHNVILWIFVYLFTYLFIPPFVLVVNDMVSLGYFNTCNYNADCRAIRVFSLG